MRELATIIIDIFDWKGSIVIGNLIIELYNERNDNINIYNKVTVRGKSI